jgi:CheY-like chemotaxis protein
MADKKTKVLIVDDDEVIRIYFHDIFWIYGFEDRCELSVAADLDAAERTVVDPASRPSIVFLDLSLPKKVGGRTVIDPRYSFDFVKRIKADPLMSETRVVMLSDHAEKEFEAEAKEAGVDIYLRKGENLPKDIVELVSRLLAK